MAPDDKFSPAVAIQITRGQAGSMFPLHPGYCLWRRGLPIATQDVDYS